MSIYLDTVGTESNDRRHRGLRLERHILWRLSRGLSGYRYSTSPSSISSLRHLRNVLLTPLYPTDAASSLLD